MSKTIVVVSCLAVTALLVAACFFCQMPVDRSMLTGDPCEPPCWQGLTPGESTLEDVNEFMRTSGFVSPLTVFHSALRNASGKRVGLSIFWDSINGRGGGDFHIEDGVLEDMFIYPSYHLTLEDLIDRYGPPEKYVANLSSPEVLVLEVTLFYPAYGFTADLWLRPGHWTLQPDTTVGRVYYLRAAPLEEFLQLGHEAGYFGSPPASGQEFGRDWKGYGPIDLE